MATLPRLLIAEGDCELLSALAETFSHGYQVKVCQNGFQVREQLKSFQPDLLLLDLMLPGVDGVTLLREIPPSHRPVTMVISLFSSPYIQAAMQQLSVEFLFTKPLCLPALADRMQELASVILPMSTLPAEPNEALYYLLRDMGIPPRANGFSYLTAGIPKFMADPNQALTKELYPALGRQFNKSALCIERSIRSAIEGAWKRGGYQSWDAFFPTMPDGTVPKPSNGDFLCAVAAHLLQLEKERTRAV